jgi:hypothetical protein
MISWLLLLVGLLVVLLLVRDGLVSDTGRVKRIILLILILLVLGWLFYPIPTHYIYTEGILV